MKIINNPIPRHVAIVMDGNGRWAKLKNLSRVSGHRAGVESVRKTIQFCIDKKIEVLSLFAFSSENWRRPKSEVKALMELFSHSLKQETKKLHEHNIRIRFIGDRNNFTDKLLMRMQHAETLTAQNTGLCLVIAVNYGGQWDILNAVQQLALKAQKGELNPEQINNQVFQEALALGDLPQPDLFIRTSGEQRLSNFFLWQLAYTELYFPPIYWPDFGKDEFEKALNYYANRQRRFGYTAEQVELLEDRV